MRRALLLLLFHHLLATVAAPACAAQTGADEALLSKMCPLLPSHSLSSDEVRVVSEVLRHYRQAEWDAVQARKAGTFAHSDFARHAVSALRSPQVLLLETIAHKPWFDIVLSVEFQRHAIPVETAHTLLDALRSRNAEPYTLQLPELHGVIGLSCRDRMSAMYGGKRLKGDFTNAATAVAISRPVFANDRKTALVLAVNDRGPHRANFEELEFILLRAVGDDKWTIASHSNTGGAYQPQAADAPTTVTSDDYRVFDAVLGHLRTGRFSKQNCVAVVNQTRTTVGPGHREITDASPSAATNRARRSVVSMYLGGYTPRSPGKLVQREEVAQVGQKERSRCDGAIGFTLPGYDAAQAIVHYWLQTSTGAGVEFGTGWALLRRFDNGWRVDRDSYQRSLLLPR
jgi:hypothetical protein